MMRAWLWAGALVVFIAAASDGRAVESPGLSAGPSPAERAEIDRTVREHFNKCWSPQHALGPNVITVQFQLNPNGSLLGAPTLAAGQSSSPDAVAQAAIAAVRKCTPITLPPAHHAYWRDVRIKFLLQAIGRPFGASAWPQ